MAEFLTAFRMIDTDFSGDITRGELEAYCRKQNFQGNFVEKWLEIFDIDHSGSISIDEFCDTLGLRPDQDYLEKIHLQRSLSLAGLEVMEGVRVFAVDAAMPEELTRQIVMLGRVAQERFKAERDVAKFVKCELDSRDQCAWQVIVGRRNYGSYCGHEIGYLLHFFVNRFAILVWRTPGY